MSGFKGFETWDETYVHHKGTDDRNILQTRKENLGLGRENRAKGEYSTLLMGTIKELGATQGFMSLFTVVCYGQSGKKSKDFLSVDIPKLVRRDGDLVPNYERRPEPIKVHLPLSVEDSLKHTQVANGLDISLFASEELGLYSVIEIDWDEKGRAWVIETRDYPNELKPAELGQDRIRILEDTDNDGKKQTKLFFCRQTLHSNWNVFCQRRANRSDGTSLLVSQRHQRG